MKILFLATHAKSLLTFRLPLMRSFLADGWQVVAVAPGDPAEWSERFAAHGVRFCAVPIDRNGLNPLADLRAYLALKRLFQAEKPDRLFCSQAKAVVYGVPAAAAAGCPECYALVSGLGSVFRGSDNSLKTRVVRAILSRQYRYALRKARVVFFQNEDDRGVFVQRGMVDGAKTRLIAGSGVDTKKFAPTPLPQVPTFLMVARLLRDKGVREYLAACRQLRSRHPSCRCLLVGPFDSNPTALPPSELQPYLDDGSVEYLGELDDVRPAYAQAGIFVLPSYHEGTPMSTLEALSCGRAVITTDAPGCRETVRDGVNGLLVPPRDAGALLQAMEELLAAPDRVAQMGAAGRRLAEEHFAAELVTKQILSAME